MATQTQYDRLLDRIYDAALDPRCWSDVLESLATLTKSRGFGYPAATAMVFLGSADADARIDEHRAARIYGLSGAEARLLKALLEGGRLNDYANEAGITLNTAKGYLKQIFHKTSTSRQADLLRLFFADPVLRIASSPGKKSP